MAEIEATAQAPAGTGEGIATSHGQAGDSAPAGSVSTRGSSEQPRSDTPADPSEQTPPAEADSEFGWKSLEDAKRDHKALQRVFTRNQQAYAQLGDVKTLAQERALLSQLREHPGFIQWVQAELAKEATGSGDPDTAKALQIVQDQARQIANEAVAPLYAAHVEQKVKTTFSEMDREFGTEWQQLKPKMNELLQTWKAQGLVSPTVDHNFDFNFVRGLYAAAAAADPQFAAKAYQKRLEQKQAQTTTSQPGTPAAATATAPATSMRDAYAQARRQLGMA
jgi:hypothetical protein